MTPKRIGSRVFVRFENILVPCVVTDTRRAYGNDRYEVQPVGGRGRQVVDAGRIDCPENGQRNSRQNPGPETLTQ